MKAFSVPAAAALLAGLAALSLSWSVELTPAGRVAPSGWTSVSPFAPAFAVLGLVLLAVTVRRREPGIFAAAAVAGALAAAVCVLGRGDAGSYGPGLWLPAAGFGLAAVLAGLAALTDRS